MTWRSARGRRSSYAAALVLCCWCSLPARAHAERLALLVGNDEGQSGDRRLRYAESDATRFRSLLTRIGGFAPDTTVLQLGGTAAELRQAMARIGARLAGTPGEHLVVVYYSGHADAQALHMGASSFSLAELQAALAALPAAVRVLILDACQAGVLTRAKGGHPGPWFESSLEGAPPTRGLAILAASAGSELAQESDELGGSVFTHYLQAGLAGLADRNRDGSVSLGEAFDYASERTLATTMGTTTGPQHPTFRLDLTGRDDLVLTRPGLRGVGYGQIRLDVPGWYFIRRRDGTIAAEVVSHGAELLALDAGPYEVTRRGRSELDVANVSVVEGQASSVSGASSYPVAFGRMVRKGGGPESAYGVAVAAAARSSIEALGPSLGLAMVGRLDRSTMSFELRAGLGRAHQEAQHLSSSTWETQLAVAALRARDFATAAHPKLPTLALGIEAGVSYLWQRLDDGERRSSLSPFFGPSVVTEVMVGHRLSVRWDLAVPIYLVRVRQGAAPTTEVHPALFTAVGAGTWF
jgi:hypothetical protein